jgi:hypothetical protein
MTLSIQQISDRLEIYDILMKYFRGVDRMDIELIRSCFCDGAPMDYPPFYKGDRDGWIEWAQGPDVLAGFTRTFHFAGNFQIELGSDIATTEIYAIPQHSTKEESPYHGAFVSVWMRYLDRFERHDEQWRIADRHVVVEWLRQDTADMWSEVPEYALGRRGRNDPSYTRGLGSSARAPGLTSHTAGLPVSAGAAAAALPRKGARLP